MLFPLRPTFGAFKKYQFISDLVLKIYPDSNFELFGISTDRKEQDVKQVAAIGDELKKSGNHSLQYEVSYNHGRNIGEEVLDKSR